MVDPLAGAIAVLLVEGDPATAGRIETALAEQHGFQVEWLASLDAALERLARGGIEVVLLDLDLPDGGGNLAVDRVCAAASEVLIMVLSATDEEPAVVEAVRRGAHDYVAKNRIDAHWLPRAIRYALERKLVQDALITSEARFRAMSEASPLGIFVSDAAGNCVYTNQAYHKISGLSFAQALGTRWSNAIHPADRSRVLADWRGAGWGEAPIHSEVRFLRSDGSIVWTRLNVAAMGEGKACLGHVQTVEDISARKAVESGLRAAEEDLFAAKEQAQVRGMAERIAKLDEAGKLEAAVAAPKGTPESEIETVEHEEGWILNV